MFQMSIIWQLSSTKIVLSFNLSFPNSAVLKLPRNELSTFPLIAHIIYEQATFGKDEQEKRNFENNLKTRRMENFLFSYSKLFFLCSCTKTFVNSFPRARLFFASSVNISMMIISRFLLSRLSGQLLF